MNDEIEVISDGDGLAVIGDSKAVERFIESSGLSLGEAFSAAAPFSQSAVEIANNSGRWVKLTKESAKRLDHLPLTPTKTRGVSHAMFGKRGRIEKWMQIETPSMLSKSPAVLSGVAGIMAQMAMEQAMQEITDYLRVIDEKLDDVLRAQTNQVLARLDGVDLAVREAMSVRAAVGRVSEVTWSKVQGSAQAIHETEGYALRQLADLADKIEAKTKISDLAEVTGEAEADAKKWVMVLGRCFELHDAVGVLELDRVLDSSPEELDSHRLGLKTARQGRLDLISERTEALLARMNAAVELANSKVLFNPKQSPAIVSSSNQVSEDVLDFHEVLGIEGEGASAETRRWGEAAEDHWDTARATGSIGMDAARKLGSGTRGRAMSVKDRLAERVAERKLALRRDAEEDDQPE